MSKITYTNKVALNVNSSIPEINKITDDNMNEIKSVVNENDTRLTTVEGEINNGWKATGETWTYSSVDNPTGVITISGDKTTKYSLGMKIKFTNNSNTIYGIITKISYSSPNTTLTFLHEINTSTGNTALHLMTNSTITNNYYSSMKAPYGFPINEEKWSILYSYTGSIITQPNPTVETLYNVGSLAIILPIGLWKDLGYSANIRADKTTAGICKVICDFSSSISSVSDSDLRTIACVSSVNNVRSSVSASKPKNITTKTTYYLLLSTNAPDQSQIALDPSQQPVVLKAVCAYL